VIGVGFVDTFIAACWAVLGPALAIGFVFGACWVCVRISDRFRSRRDAPDRHPAVWAPVVDVPIRPARSARRPVRTRERATQSVSDALAVLDDHRRGYHDLAVYEPGGACRYPGCDAAYWLIASFADLPE
jgi:hypothetical protein